MPKDVIDTMKSLVGMIYDIGKNMPRFKDIERAVYDKDYKATIFELFKEGDLAMYTDLEEYAQTFFGDTKNHKIINLIKGSIEQ